MKNVFILLLLAFCIHINAQIINFPDANFKKALVNSKCVDTNGDNIGDSDADLNDDGEIDADEALNVTILNVESKQIYSLEGIENFTNLIKLECAYNQVNSLNVQGLTKLTYLICSYNIITTLNVQGLNNLISLNCKSNKLTSLNVNGVTNLTYMNCEENQITSLNLNELTKITYIDCGENQLTSLNVQGLTNLLEFRCSYNKLTSLDVNETTNLRLLECNNNKLISLNVNNLTNLIHLTCSKNKLITLDVNGLEKLKFLECQSNDLRSLFMKTGNVGLAYFIQLNYQLIYICCNEILINQIQEEAIRYGYKYCEVNSYCSFIPGGKFFVLKGENKYDSNSNGCDTQDNNIPNLKFNITGDNISGTFISNTTGNYQIPVQAGTHTITPKLEEQEGFTITPPSFTITFPSTSDTITQNFCITPKGIFRQTNITVLPLSPPARPGFDASYKIVWENVGNQIESGTLNFTYDETLLDYISATQTPDQIADGIVKWNFTNLLPFEKREISVTLKVNRPTDTPAVNAGDKLYLTASILDNIFTLENTVVGSYDPNDKTCLQGDRVKPDMVGKYVDYLIRFENTGNYAAENVVVKDIIDTKRFDVSTLQITDASHEVYTRIEGNKVEFIFENIQLPFDDANNDGYIAFKIKTLPTLILGDSLKNMADIYFDYNFPIRTNEAKTTIALSVSTADITTDISIYPNPVRDILNISTEETWTKAEIYDISGRIMRSISLMGNSIDLSGLESGTYVVKLRNDDKSGNVKFVKM